MNFYDGHTQAIFGNPRVEFVDPSRSDVVIRKDVRNNATPQFHQEFEGPEVRGVFWQ